MGTPQYATIIFKSLFDNHFNILSIITQPDKPVGRKNFLQPPHIKKFVIDNNIDIKILQPSSLKDYYVYEYIKTLKPDYIIVAAYGHILNKRILEIAPCINLHASLLPLYRGASPIQESIINNDKYTGVTAMLMNEGLDTGDILGFRYFKLENNITIDKLFLDLSKIASKLIIEVLNRFDGISPKKQDNLDSSLCKKIQKSYGQIKFDNALEIYIKYRAYLNWPGIFLESGLKLKDISLIDTLITNQEGEILSINKDYIIVGCKKGSLEIKTIQVPSKKPLSSFEYIKGYRLKIGDVLN